MEYRPLAGYPQLHPKKSNFAVKMNGCWGYEPFGGFLKWRIPTTMGFNSTNGLNFGWFLHLLSKGPGPEISTDFPKFDPYHHWELVNLQAICHPWYMGFPSTDHWPWHLDDIVDPHSLSPWDLFLNGIYGDLPQNISFYHIYIYHLVI
jgi:hypothetical protein